MVTMKDIADKVGVTKQTVSQVLNNYKAHMVGKTTREKIKQVARELNYKPNRLAQVFRSGRTQMIGVETGIAASFQFGHYYLDGIYQGISDECRKKNYKLVVDNFFHDAESSRELNQGRLVDGVIFVLISSEMPHFRQRIGEELKNTGIPYAVIHSLREDQGCNNVGLDCVHGGKLAVEHLREHGYRSIRFVLSEDPSLMMNDLVEGYRQGCKGLPELMYRITIGGYDGGIDLAKKVGNGRKERPRAFLVSEDSVAYGMITGFREMGLKVPEDVAVIGFGDQADQTVLQTDLTTIKQPAREKGQQAVKMVLGQLNNSKKKNSFKLIKPELVIRGSCGCK